MAEALIRGMLAAHLFSPEDILIIDPDPGRTEYLTKTYGVEHAASPQQLCDLCLTLILAVKPQVCDAVLRQYTGISSEHLVISIMAGIPIGVMEKLINAPCKIIRAMPNTPALVLAGATAISLNEQCLEDDRKIANNIFSAIGICVEVPEPQLDAVTGLSGSGPGYIFTIIDGLIDGGVLAGLPRPVAQQLVLQTVYGSAKLGLESNENASALKAMVTSPGGTTIHGIQQLEQHGIRSALMAAVHGATQRSQELGS